MYYPRTNVTYSLILDNNNTRCDSSHLIPLRTFPSFLLHRYHMYDASSIRSHHWLIYTWAIYYRRFMYIWISDKLFTLRVSATFRRARPWWQLYQIGPRALSSRTPSSADSNPWRTCVTTGTMQCFSMNLVASSRSLWEPIVEPGTSDVSDRCNSRRGGNCT